MFLLPLPWVESKAKDIVFLPPTPPPQHTDTDTHTEYLPSGLGVTVPGFPHPQKAARIASPFAHGPGIRSA